MTLNGGAMQMSTTLPEGTSDPVFSDTAIKSGGYGIIDVAWKVGVGALYVRSRLIWAIKARSSLARLSTIAFCVLQRVGARTHT